MKKNPWKVKSIQDFACLNCPECDFNTNQETFLQDHAVENHPLCFAFCANSIQSFSCLKCPECEFNTKDETSFEDHAVEKHPLSFVLFGKIRSVNLSSILFKVISTRVILKNTLLEMADKALPITDLICKIFKNTLPPSVIESNIQKK